jgi:maltooligosyltrehalose trehalohydrolase
MRTPLRFGPRLEAGGGVTFRLWAPAAKRVDLVGDASVSLAPAGGGWFEAFVPQARPGFRYRYRIDDEIDVPDPASHFQPDDVFGASEVVAHDFDWQAADWKGRPWDETVLLELHLGTFTPHGSYRAAIDKLDHLVETGVTAIELMPLADFPGARNWGYDGVLWYAPDSAYGTPDDLKALVDAAHARGLMVFLDVVYNHFGPEGNFLGRYAPAFFTEQHHTPWGAAIDYRVDEVRAFAVENALHWLSHYRFDGLRLDAVHAIVEPGTPSMLEALSRAVGELAAEAGRHIHLVLENDDNIAAFLDPATAVPQGRYRAQWNDDYHHAWHALLTREARGYYIDYTDESAKRIARALSDGFIYQGDASRHRKGAIRGERSRHLPPAAFVNFIQNHDQIGNRAFGERLTALAQPEAIDAALAVTLLAPFPPLLFMGEEWGATQPFPFFCDFTGDLADAVRRGRAAEFEGQFKDLPADKPIPDPLAAETFRSAMLDWDELDRKPHAARLALVRALLAKRQEFVVPLAAKMDGDCGSAEFAGAVLRASWRCRDGQSLALIANLSDSPTEASSASANAQPVWGGGFAGSLAPWAVHWWREAA